jgi:hypothetical protein
MSSNASLNNIFISQKEKKLEEAIKYVTKKKNIEFENISIHDFLQEVYRILTGKEIDRSGSEIDIIIAISNILWNTYRKIDSKKTQELRNLLLQPEIVDIIVKHEIQLILDRIQISQMNKNTIRFDNTVSRKNTNVSNLNYQTLIDALYKKIRKMWGQIETYPGSPKLELNDVFNDKVSEYYQQIKYILTKGIGLKETDERYKRIMSLFIENSINKISNNISLDENQHTVYKGVKRERVFTKPFSNWKNQKKDDPTTIKYNYITDEIRLYDFLHQIYKRLLYIYEKKKQNNENSLETKNNQNLLEDKKNENALEKIQWIETFDTIQQIYDSNNEMNFIEKRKELEEKYRTALMKLLDNISDIPSNDTTKVNNIRNKITAAIPFILEGQFIL